MLHATNMRPALATCSPWVKSADLVGGRRKACWLYGVWCSMRNRCLNPGNDRFDSYGGRGITISSEWDDYAAFRAWAIKNGYRKGLTLDRRDNDGNYEPANCRWVTKPEQLRNKRNTLRFRGEAACAIAAANGIGRQIMYDRIKSGWDLERAITTPPRPKRQ